MLHQLTAILKQLIMYMVCNFKMLQFMVLILLQDDDELGDGLV